MVMCHRLTIGGMVVAVPLGLALLALMLLEKIEPTRPALFGLASVFLLFSGSMMAHMICVLSRADTSKGFQHVSRWAQLVMSGVMTMVLLFIAFFLVSSR